MNPSITDAVVAGLRSAEGEGDVGAALRQSALEGLRSVHPLDEAPDAWSAWTGQLFPEFRDFAPHHVEFWEWLFAIEPGVCPRPFIGIWPRGGGKSSSAELAAVAVGARDRRKYCIYVRATQDQADKSVANIAGLLESDALGRAYPRHAERAIGKYGASKGWRRNRLRTEAGYTIDALGLDVATRGIKVDQQRPDLIVLDDLDNKHDSPLQTRKKLETITHSILPAGSSDAAVIGIQNLIIPDGIFSRLADGRADFLQDRIVSGPFPAVHDLQYEGQEDDDGVKRWVITGGEPSWAGQDLGRCEDLMNRIGVRAFLEECQHQFQAREGALWQPEMIDQYRGARHDFGDEGLRWARYIASKGIWVPVPKMLRIVVGVDPSVSDGETTAETGAIVAGLGADEHLYVFDDVSSPRGLHICAPDLVFQYERWYADAVVGEANNGGDLVESTIRTHAPGISYLSVRAARGKLTRAEPIASLYRQGLVHHLGRFPDLEHQMTHWVPGEKSPDHLDALVWALTELWEHVGAWRID